MTETLQRRAFKERTDRNRRVDACYWNLLRRRGATALTVGLVAASAVVSSVALPAIARAGSVTSSPPAVVVDPIPSSLSSPADGFSSDFGGRSDASPYDITPQPFAVRPAAVTVPLQLQQPAETARRSMAQVHARQLSQALELPAPSTGLQLPSDYHLAARQAAAYMDLSDDAEASRPVVPLPPAAWGGIASITLLVCGWAWTRRRHLLPIG